MPHLDKEPQPFFESQKSSHSKKEMASKMYSTSRCGKCNRFGHSHDKCTGMTKVMGQSVREGSKKHTRLSSDKKHYDDLNKSETN